MKLDRNFFFSKKVAKTGAIASGATLLLSLSATAVIAAQGAVPAGSVCATAYIDGNPDINNSKCFNPERGVFNNPSVNLPSDETEKEENRIFAEYKCGSESLTITQEEWDHSNKNKELLNAGKSNEVTPYPGDNWRYIVDINEAYPNMEGAAFVIDENMGNIESGNFDDVLKNTTRSNAPSYLTSSRDEDNCTVVSTKNKVPHSYSNDSPASYTYLNYDGVEEEIRGYFQEGKPHRDNDLPNYTYHLNGKLSQEEYRLGDNNTKHRLNGPAFTQYDESGKVINLSFNINGKEIINRSDWISKGGTPEGWDNNITEDLQ